MKLLLITITCLGLATQLKGQNLFSGFFENSCYPQCDPSNSVCKYSYSRFGYFCECLDGYTENILGECVGCNLRCNETKSVCKYSYWRNVYFCECFAGYIKNETDECVDIDECRQHPFPCSSGTRCVNDVGSFRCLQCRLGYEFKGYECIDINECVNDLSLCSPNVCLNTPGSYKCVCDSGYEMKGRYCKDINECRTSPCPANSDCRNTEGSFNCQCRRGFQLKNGVCTAVYTSPRPPPTTPWFDPPATSRRPPSTKQPPSKTRYGQHGGRSSGGVFPNNVFRANSLSTPTGLTTEANGQDMFTELSWGRCNPPCNRFTSRCKFSSRRFAYYCECLDGYIKDKMGECVYEFSYYIRRAFRQTSAPKTTTATTTRPPSLS